MANAGITVIKFENEKFNKKKIEDLNRRKYT